MTNSNNEDRELSKGMMVEVLKLIDKKFDDLKVELRLMFMTKEGCAEEHKNRDRVYEALKKQINVYGTISIIAICVAMVALGMRIEDMFIRLIGFIK